MRAAILRLLAAGIAAVASVSAAATIRIVATTSDLAALAVAVGGDLVSAQSIIPAGADPEAFEPRPGDLDKLRAADLVVRVGLGHDYWLDALVRRIGDKRLMRGGSGYLDASAGIPLLEIRGQTVINEGGHAHGVANPHYWLDPDNAVIVSAGIAEALVRLAPQDRERIVATRARFLAELSVRRERWSQSLSDFAGVKLIAYHNSWPYFARRFRLDIVDVIEPKPGVAPSPARLARLLFVGRASDVRAIVHEPHAPEDASRLLAKKLEIPMVRLAVSVGSLPGTGDYFALFDHNVETLARALRKRTP